VVTELTSSASDSSRSGSTPATVALANARIPFTVHTYRHDPATANYGTEAAQALGVEPARVFKTLFLSVDDTLVVGIVPVSGRLDLKAVAAALKGKRATMADPADAERASGYLVGAISPIGQKRPHTTVLDESAMAFGAIYVSGGRRGMELEIAPADLRRITGATMASIGRI